MLREQERRAKDRYKDIGRTRGKRPALLWGGTSLRLVVDVKDVDRC